MSIQLQPFLLCERSLRRVRRQVPKTARPSPRARATKTYRQNTLNFHALNPDREYILKPQKQ